MGRSGRGAGSDAYHVLVDLYGWTHSEWIDWTIATIAEQVFGRRQSEMDAIAVVPD